MPRWTRDEIEEQWAHYQKVARRCGPAGNWDEFVDLYTEDAVMIVSGAGKIGGREAMRRWYREAFAVEPMRWLVYYPVEWLRGGRDVARFLAGEVEGAAGNVRFAPSDTEAFEEGTVGWAATKLTITLPDGKRFSPRWTSVFHQEGDVWKFVQTHASIGVANDQVGWEYA